MGLGANKWRDDDNNSGIGDAAYFLLLRDIVNERLRLSYHMMATCNSTLRSRWLDWRVRGRNVGTDFSRFTVAVRRSVHWPTGITKRKQCRHVMRNSRPANMWL